NNISTYRNKRGQAEVLGVHLEGPFIEPSKKGAQPGQYIMKPDIQQFQKWQKRSGYQIKTVTLAPEHDEDGELIRKLFKSGVNVSAYHKAIDFKVMNNAVADGVRQGAHQCHEMHGSEHRCIGVIGADYQLKQLRAEILA